MLKVEGENLDRGNDPLLEHAAALVAAGGSYPVSFEVIYHRPHAAQGEPVWSSPDVVTVTEGGQISA